MKQASDRFRCSEVAMACSIGPGWKMEGSAIALCRRCFCGLCLSYPVLSCTVVLLPHSAHR